jgi:hypothetical protein
VLDFDKMTIGELAKVEDLTGLSIGALMRPDAPQAKKIAAIAVIVRKRRGEPLSWADALELTMTDIQAIFAGEPDVESADDPDEDEGPKEPSPSPAPRTSRSSSSRSASSRRSTGS